MVLDHVGDLQVFQGDPVVASDQGTGQFVQVILPPLGDVFMLSLQRQHGLLPVGACELPPGHPPLEHPQLSLFGPVPAGIVDHFVVAGRQEMMQAHIDTDFPPGGRQRLFQHFTGKTGIPLAGLSAQTHSLDPPDQGAVPAEPHPPDPRQAQAPPFDLKAISVFLQPEAIEAVGSFEARISRRLPGFHPPEEGLEGVVQIHHDDLQVDNASYGSQE